MGERTYARTRKRETATDRFFDEFAPEIDIFDCEGAFPNWVYDFREQNLRKVGKNFRLVCQILKDEGLRFKVKYPVEIHGKWKFADFYIPKHRLVVLLLSERDVMGIPCTSMSDKEWFFKDRFRTLAIMPYEIDKLRSKLSAIVG